jgi:hypothetical protein
MNWIHTEIYEIIIPLNPLFPINRFQNLNIMIPNQRPLSIEKRMVFGLLMPS